MVNAERLETRFFEDIGSLVADEKLLRSWMAVPRAGHDDVVALKRELKRLEAENSEEAVHARRDKLFGLAMSASVDEVEFKRQMNRLDREVSEKLARVATIRATLSESHSRTKGVDHALSLLRRFDELYRSAEYELKREIVSSLCEALGGVSVSRRGLNWKRLATKRG